MKKLFLIASIALSVNGFAQKVEGRLNFPKGQKLELVTESVKTTTMELMGQSMESAVTSTVTETFDIEDVTAAGATMEHKVKRVVFNASGMGNSQSFDSDKAEDRNSDMGKMLDKNLKSKDTLTVDATGIITAVKAGVDTAKKNEEADAIAGLVSSQLGFNLGVPKVGDLSVFKILPGKEIKMGDSWRDSTSASGQTVTTIYKVTGITPTEIILEYTGNVNINTTQQIMGQDASLKSDDKVIGQITLDKNTGLLKQKTATIDTKATMEAQGMSIPSTGKTTITVTLKAS